MLFLKLPERNLKSEFLLQLVVFGMTAAIIALLFSRIYPSDFIKSLKNGHNNPTVPEVKTLAKPEISPPTEISFPSLNLSLVVSPGVIKDDTWTLFDDKVSWLATSETPSKGNVIIYGHNRAGLFGNLDKLKIGEQISLKSADKTFTYVLAKKRKISPEDVDAIISPKDQLTLYTCDGSFDEKRLVLIAYPKQNKI